MLVSDITYNIFIMYCVVMNVKVTYLNWVPVLRLLV